MDPPNKGSSSASKSKKAGKKKALPRTEALLKRQSQSTPFTRAIMWLTPKMKLGDKLWLETHIWHAKRMKMETIWGYRLVSLTSSSVSKAYFSFQALHPTEKAFRSSHRASRHGCILHDASYHEIIEVRGPQALLVSLLDVCCESLGSPSSIRYLTGARACEALFYAPNSYPYDLIGPVTIIWCPTTSQGSGDLAHSSRTVWLICHPSIFESAFQSLVVSSSFAVEASRPDDNRKRKVEVVDLRGKFNTFELMGPKSSQVIKGALTPVSDCKLEEFNRVSFAPPPPLPRTSVKCIGLCPLVLGCTAAFTMS